MNFNKDRFANFAKYDLTINKTFFRNLVFVTIAGAVGIAMLGFMIRYNIYREAVTSPWGGTPDPTDFEHYNSAYITAGYELIFSVIMMSIFAGCWAHNLRSKQGRITELTLPATNLEKFTWHALLMLVGGFVLCLSSLLIADGLNALLTLMVFGAGDGVSSLTWSAGEIISLAGTSNPFFHVPGVTINGEETTFDAPERWLLLSFVFFIISSTMTETFAFLFGNSLKYRYNIILTYIALQVIGTVGSILFFIGTAFAAGNVVDTIADSGIEGTDVAAYMTGCFTTIGTLACLISILFVWWSYKRYTKAQITSSLNK